MGGLCADLGDFVTKATMCLAQVALKKYCTQIVSQLNAFDKEREQRKEQGQEDDNSKPTFFLHAIALGEAEFENAMVLAAQRVVPKAEFQICNLSPEEWVTKISHTPIHAQFFDKKTVHPKLRDPLKLPDVHVDGVTVLETEPTRTSKNVPQKRTAPSDLTNRPKSRKLLVQADPPLPRVRASTEASLILKTLLTVYRRPNPAMTGQRRRHLILHTPMRGL